MIVHRVLVVGVICFVALGLTACKQGRGSGSEPEPRVLKCAEARLVSRDSDLVPGPLARGRMSDLVIENDRIRVIVQKGGRNWFNIGQFGGNIIDAVPKEADGSISVLDHFEEHALGTNIESSPNYQQVLVLDRGGEDPQGNCRTAKIRATGPDDLLDFVNGSSAIRDLGLFFPRSADDVDLPVTIQTDYTLDSGQRHVRIDTTLINESSTDQRIYLAEYLSGSGEIEVFQSGYGFGEAFVTAPCSSCNFVIYAGHEGGSGVSYGFIHDNTGNLANTTTVSVSGVTVILYGRDTLLLAATPEELQPTVPAAQPNFTVPANGQMTLTRYFAVGDGTVASVLDIRNDILGITTGTLEGVVEDASGPVAGAEIAVLSAQRDFPPQRGPSLIVKNHFRTDAQGRYRGTLPPGSYSLRVNMPGRLAATPENPSVSVNADQVTAQNFTLPPASGIRVTVTDQAGQPVPAKVQLVGLLQGPDAAEPLNSESVLGGALTVRTGIFGDPFADALPPGISLAEFAVLDSGSGAVAVGDTGELFVEPGTYQLSVSRGPRYSEFVQEVTITEGQLTGVTAQVREVVSIPNHIFGDFHVHSFDSPDSEVTNRERVATYVSEDVDFFAASDHGMRVDFRPVVAGMGLDAWVATTPSAEVTTFDYGHFNLWPVRIETQSPDSEVPNEGHSTDPLISRGSTDWGGKAPLGKDFPSQGNFVLSPQEIFDQAAQDPFMAGRQVVRQINHIDSHFGAVGLQIDTGRNPPASSADAPAKRLNPAYANPDFSGSNNYFSDRFDTLEVWIGTDGRNGQNTAFIDQNLGDWLNLLNQGRRRTGMSNSDTHERRVTSLHTRNMISVPPALLDMTTGRANAREIAADPHTVGDSVRAGYSTMTNAPTVTVKAKNAVAQVAGLELSDAFGVQSKPLPLATAAEPVTLDIDVMSPAWAAYDQILVFVNTHTVRHTDALGQPTSPPRYRLCAPQYRFDLGNGGINRSEVNVNDAQRFETKKTLTIDSPGKDYWIVVMVRGTDGQSVPLWPVVPNSFVNNDGSLTGRSTADRGVMALAVSNPIFVDADRDGVWAAPGLTEDMVHAGTRLPPDPCPGGNMPAP